jgi:uncharacterized protein (TIGR03435 family)
MHLRRIPCLCASALLIAGAAWAQNKPPAFEVAEIKINPDPTAKSKVSVSGGRFLATNVPLRPLIAEAWTITPDGVVGPSWLDDFRVDIVAKAPSPETTDADLRLMLRNLFEDRLKLVSHTENRERSVLALVIWKGVPKLTASSAPQSAEEGDCTLGRGPVGSRAICKHMTMARFAHELPQLAPRYIDQPVVDETNLPGAWDFTFEFAPLAEAETNGGLSLAGALQAQLGLELKGRKRPVPVLAIDSMDRVPTSN